MAGTRRIAAIVAIVVVLGGAARAADEFEPARARLAAEIAAYAVPDWFGAWPGHMLRQSQPPGGWPETLTRATRDAFSAVDHVAGAAASAAARLGFDASAWRGLADRRPIAPAVPDPDGACARRAMAELFEPYLARVAAGIAAWGPPPAVLVDADSWRARLAAGSAVLEDPRIRDPGLIAHGVRVRAGAASLVGAAFDLARAVRDLDCALGGQGISTFATRWGDVLVGTTGPDDFTADAVARAALIVDPGGDDRYALGSVGPGRQRTILDLAGNDLYAGDATAIGGFSGLVDLAGDDRHEGGFGAQAAAIGGFAASIDVAGNDDYVARSFSQAASIHGAALLAGSPGATRYRVEQLGQAFAGPGGDSLLWDMGGNNDFAAAGDPDPFARGGRLSLAQAYATGARNFVAGGSAVLRAEGPENVFALDQFGQGAAYYGGVAVLDHGPGRALFRAARYAQGVGIHQAFGALVSRAGETRFELAVGVGQGMGLDHAIGALIAGGGPKTYVAPALAQGAATAGGVGILADGDARSRFAPDPADPATTGVRRTIVTLGLGLRAVGSLAQREPFARAAARAVEEPLLECPASSDAGIPAGVDPDRAALDVAAPLFGTGDAALAAYRALADLARRAPARAVALSEDGDIARAIALREVLRCALGPDAAGRAMGALLLDRLADGMLANADAFLGLARRLAPRDDAAEGKWRAVAAGRSCFARAVGLLTLDERLGARDRDARLAAAARDPCWLVQALAWGLARDDLTGFVPAGAP